MSNLTAPSKLPIASLSLRDRPGLFIPRSLNVAVAFCLGFGITSLIIGRARGNELDVFFVIIRNGKWKSTRIIQEVFQRSSKATAFSSGENFGRLFSCSKMAWT